MNEYYNNGGIGSGGGSRHFKNYFDINYNQTLPRVKTDADTNSQINRERSQSSFGNEKFKT